MKNYNCKRVKAFTGKDKVIAVQAVKSIGILSNEKIGGHFDIGTRTVQRYCSENPSFKPSSSLNKSRSPIKNLTEACFDSIFNSCTI